MPKFGNNVETIITVFPLWGDFIDIASRKGKTKKEAVSKLRDGLFSFTTVYGV